MNGITLELRLYSPFRKKFACILSRVHESYTRVSGAVSQRETKEMIFILLLDPSKNPSSYIDIRLSSTVCLDSTRLLPMSFVRVICVWFVQENWRSMMAPAQKAVIRRLTRVARMDTTEPNLPNNCCDCNRTCINSDVTTFRAPTVYRYFRLLVFLFATPITPRQIRRFLFRRISLPPLSSYKQNMYHSSMANYEARADARYVLPMYNWAM